ncbi:rhodanese domain-containing protein [Brachyspira hampsonii 30446]|uniref:Rhodanese domain-containing protein n=3 Tax=Brachyspira hampsonii TaxID=1287055 RepID=A0A2U4F502_9SPIR|nr:rhodanese-like domain-containing protein [Brachyspira hampsonii]EKV57747.1 rhodanese domain-containing protein [Brachyspira hampsonii 30446]OEJ18499.1 sulfurtransferase [Brachyspira hampsonii]
MKKISLYFIISVSLLFVFSCSKKPYDNINLKKALDLMTKSTNLVLLDVRTAEEYMGGSAPNSINIDVLNTDFKSKIDLLDKNKEYIVYCRSGNRSSIASSIMATNGFLHVYNLQNVSYADFVNAILTNQN